MNNLAVLYYCGRYGTATARARSFEDERRVADDGHAGGSSQPFPQHAHFRAVPLDRQFRETLHVDLELQCLETSASLRRFLHLAAAVVAALGIVPPPDARGQNPGISSPREIIAGDPSAFIRLLATTRPPPISAERKALVMRSLPSEGEVERLDASAAAKLSALRPLLQGTERESVYAIKVIDVPQAAIGIHGRAVVLISARALLMLSVEELRALVAHEVGHEYVWAEYEAARLREDGERLRQLELVCDRDLYPARARDVHRGAGQRPRADNPIQPHTFRGVVSGQSVSNDG